MMPLFQVSSMSFQQAYHPLIDSNLASPAAIPTAQASKRKRDHAHVSENSLEPELKRARKP